MEDTVTKTAHIEGRLKGLNELVWILKDTMDSQDAMTSSTVLKSIVSHISHEVESIIADLEGENSGDKHPALAEASKQQQGLEQAASSPKEITIPLMKKQVETADALMKNLSEFRKQRSGSYLFNQEAEDSEK